MLLFLFIVGLLVGSFINVVALRLPKGETFCRGRSHCTFCQKTLRWFELVPVLSFLWQGGKCRKCQKNLSWRYPVVEVATGALFAGLYYFLSGIGGTLFWPTLVFYLIIFSGLEIVFLIDLKDGVIPDILVWPLTVLVLFFWIIFGGGALNYLLSGLGCAAFFAIQYFASRGRWIGAGDIGLGLLLGALLGFPKILVGLFFTYICGALVSIILIILKKKQWTGTLPFAVFLIPGALFALFWGGFLWEWYLGIIGFF